MTEEEWKAWETQRAGQMSMKNDLPAPVTQRLDWLEADASAQRTAILKLEWRIYVVAIAVALVGLAALVLSIALEVRT